MKKQLLTTTIAEEKIIPHQVVFVVQRDVGREIRQNLEEKTNLAAEILDID